MITGLTGDPRWLKEFPAIPRRPAVERVFRVVGQVSALSGGTPGARAKPPGSTQCGDAPCRPVRLGSAGVGREQPFRLFGGWFDKQTLTAPAPASKISTLQLPSLPYSRQSIGRKHRARDERRPKQSDGTAASSAGLDLGCTNPFQRAVAKGERPWGGLLPCGVTAISKTLSSCHALPDHFLRTLS